MPEIGESATRKKGGTAAPVVTEVTTRTKTVSSEPPAEGAKEKRPDISDWFAALTPDEMQHCAFYLYRLNPDVQTMDGGKNLCRLREGDFAEFEDQDFWRGLQEWTRRHFGGSRYRLVVNNTKIRSTVYNKDFEIEGPAVLSGREGYKSGAVMPSGSSIDPSMQALFSQIVKETIERLKANAMDPSQAVSQVMDVMKSVNAQTAEMLKAQIPQQKDPIQTLESMLALIDRMGPKNPPTPTVDVEAQLEKTLSLLDKFGILPRKEAAVAPEPAANPFELVKSTMESIQALGFVRQGAGGSPRPGPEGWVIPLVQAAPLILQHVERMVDKVAGAIASRPVGPAPQAASGRPANVAVINRRGPSGVATTLGAAETRTAVSEQPRSTLVAAVHAPTPTAAAPTAEAPAPAAPAKQPSMEDLLNVWLRAKIVELFQLGVQGGDVANWLQISEPRLANFLGSLTVEDLQARIAADEILKNMLGHPRLPKFLEEFLDYFKPEAEE